jgi:hypothetical protein
MKSNSRLRADGQSAGALYPAMDLWSLQGAMLHPMMEQAWRFDLALTKEIRLGLSR